MLSTHAVHLYYFYDKYSLLLYTILYGWLKSVYERYDIGIRLYTKHVDFFELFSLASLARLAFKF